MDKNELETKIKTIAEGFASLLEVIGELATLEPALVPVEVETKVTKKKATTKKTTKKVVAAGEKPENDVEVETQKVDTKISFTAAITPKTAKETKLFVQHWGVLDEAQQTLYLKHKIDSLGRPIVELETGESSSGESVSLDDVRHALRTYAQKTDGKAAMKILGKFKAKKVSDLKEKDFGKVIEAVANA